MQPGFILALLKTYGLFKEKLFILMKFNLNSSVQLSCVQLFTTPVDSLSITNSGVHSN